MMRFLRGTFFRVGGLAYNDFEDISVQQAPPPINLAQGATVTSGMAFGATSMFTREYVLPPPRALFLPSDDFTRLPNPPGNGPLGPNWDFPYKSTGFFTPPQVITNTVREGAENLDCCAYFKGSPGAVAWEIDPLRPENIVGQFAEIVMQDPLPHNVTGNYVGVVLRCDTDRGSGVLARFYLGGVFWNGTTLDCRLYYWNGATFVAIGAPNTILPWAVGDVLRCEVIGNETPGNPCFVTLFHNGTTVLRYHVFGNAFKAGGTVNAPGPGIAIKGNEGGFWLDNWNAGELSPPADHVFHRENWTSHADGAMGQPWSFPFANRPVVNNHQLVAAATGAQGAIAYYNQTGFNGSDQYAQVRIVNLPSSPNQSTGVTLRTGGGVNAFYAGLIYGSGDYEIWLYWIGVYTMKAKGTVAGLITAGGILRCEVTGSVTPVFNMYFAGALILTYTFTDPTSEVRVGGFPGLAIFDPIGSVMKLDDWEGGRL